MRDHCRDHSNAKPCVCPFACCDGHSRNQERHDTKQLQSHNGSSQRRDTVKSIQIVRNGVAFTVATDATRIGYASVHKVIDTRLGVLDAVEAKFTNCRGLNGTGGVLPLEAPDKSGIRL